MFGATVAESHGVTAICGGTGESPLSHGQVVIFISVSQGGLQILGYSSVLSSPKDFLLMIGSSVQMSDNNLIVLGGGTSCFPSGEVWQSKPRLFEFPRSILDTTSSTGTTHMWYMESPKFLGKSQDTLMRLPSRSKPSITTIPRVTLTSANTFQELLQAGKPVVIEGLNVGPCVQKWTPDYMVERVGNDREVSRCAKWLVFACR